MINHVSLHVRGPARDPASQNTTDRSRAHRPACAVIAERSAAARRGAGLCPADARPTSATMGPRIRGPRAATAGRQQSHHHPTDCLNYNNGVRTWTSAISVKDLSARPWWWNTEKSQQAEVDRCQIPDTAVSSWPFDPQTGVLALGHP